ncbi:MAG: NDP-sugar synthase [Capsulimonadales bacterium]|nr:NDP-sugar synthase [Capsulimonadales bacterium]
MRAMILGAGIGSRLDPLTRSLPKPLVPVVGKPVMGHIMDHLRHSGITEIVVNVQYLGDRIVETIGDGSAYGVKVTYSFEDKLWGDAGGLKRVESFFRESDDETLLVVGGDDLTDTDITHIIAEHKAKGAAATIGVTPVEDPSAFGICVTDEQGFITRFQEKPKKGEAFSNLANTGIYIFDRKVFEYIPADTFYGFGLNVLPAMLAAGEPMLAVTSTAYWQDVGNLVIYRQAQRDVIDGKVKIDFVEGSTVADTCVVCPGARVDGEISDYTVVGRGAVVEAGATVKNSILWDGAVVKSGTYLENCVVGNGVTVATTHGIFNGLIVEPKRPG